MPVAVLLSVPDTGMPMARSATQLKQDVRDFWNADPCGSRYVGTAKDLEAHARSRYELEPYIPGFAGFSESNGKRVLEIGVGMGADYLEWLRNGAVAVGVDLSQASLQMAQRRCELAGLEYDLRLADAERLPFAANTFDIVYSYGVMHHSPDPAQCLREAQRVLKPGGVLRVMLYHHPSLTGLMLWLRYGLFRGKSIRESVYSYLESPGTKSFTGNEVSKLLVDFDEVEMRQVFSPGDLLLHRPSSRFQGWFYRIVLALYPRRLVRLLCRSLGLFLLISARKPEAKLYRS
jgi:ubiquinone/menaquinone biosynthesis C-methylase UbiE